MENLKEIMFSILPAIISGISSYLLSKRNFKNEVEKINISNRHDIKKLMEQHKIDIENLKEQHKLELERKEKDFFYEKEILKIKSENSINEKAQGVFLDAISEPLKHVIKNSVNEKEVSNVSIDEDIQNFVKFGV